MNSWECKVPFRPNHAGKPYVLRIRAYLSCGAADVQPYEAYEAMAAATSRKLSGCMQISTRVSAAQATHRERQHDYSLPDSSKERQWHSHTTPRKNTARKRVETLTHEQSRRKNIPTAEYQSVMQKEEQNPVRVAYERRNRDLDPQLVWRGKDEQDWSDLVVHAPPLYIQEKIHPKVLIDDLLRQTREQREHEVSAQIDLFADFNGIPKGVDKTEFYRHEQNWSNRMILGDSLQVMASLAEREGLRGKVQCIYLDPPYGIKFNSNFQWSTTSRDVKDGNVEHITREPEQVKAFRDTWRDGIHSYLTYLRDRLTVARDLLADSGSIFVQIGDENVHRVRAVMDEVFGEENFVSLILFKKTTGVRPRSTCEQLLTTLLWYCKRSRGT